jgi:hypothetical protein
VVTQVTGDAAQSGEDFAEGCLYAESAGSHALKGVGAK